MYPCLIIILISPGREKVKLVTASGSKVAIPISGMPFTNSGKTYCRDCLRHCGEVSLQGLSNLSIKINKIFNNGKIETTR